MTQAKSVASWLYYNYVQINLKEKKPQLARLRLIN